MKEELSKGGKKRKRKKEKGGGTAPDVRLCGSSGSDSRAAGDAMICIYGACVSTGSSKSTKPMAVGWDRFLYAISRISNDTHEKRFLRHFPAVGAGNDDDRNNNSKKEFRTYEVEGRKKSEEKPN
ncbi:hypothetical protein OUZ56_013823 [Daphnia magna]|uniref:Uncharacterized protein n=1 Tax=Daphnia magna TaxID=35525 RepID=A0ABQ9Z721_9CRUS|nr:hypothetical protein OUZ56_013823 [Daphnia magna]